MVKNIWILLLLLVVSCGGTKEEAIKVGLVDSWDKYYVNDYDKTAQVDVYVVTNRNKKSKDFSCEIGVFGVEESKKVNFGSCKINVPKHHIVGSIPDVITNKGLIHKHFKILQEESLEKDNLVARIKQTRRSPLIFVHGFNVKFHEAVIRSSQIAHDLKYQGPIILFSWPAGGDGSTVSMIDQTYRDNLKNAKFAINDFSQFLVLLKNNGITPNILVHSMGHQLVLNSLEVLNKKYPDDKFMDKLILNAPDFEVDRFNEIKKNIQSVANNVTIYCAKNDKAIAASNNINGSKRLGECLIIDAKHDTKIDLIDVTLVNNSFLGHGYYYSREVLTDMFQNLIGIKASRRMFIVEKDFHENQYYLRK